MLCILLVALTVTKYVLFRWQFSTCIFLFSTKIWSGVVSGVLQAEENGILFMPIQGRTQEAKQVYRFGKNMIYLDRSVVFICEKNNQWVPISLQNLVDVSIGWIIDIQSV